MGWSALLQLKSSRGCSEPPQPRTDEVPQHHLVQMRFPSTAWYWPGSPGPVVAALPVTLSPVTWGPHRWQSCGRGPGWGDKPAPSCAFRGDNSISSRCTIQPAFQRLRLTKLPFELAFYFTQWVRKCRIFSTGSWSSHSITSKLSVWEQNVMSKMLFSIFVNITQQKTFV